MDYNKYEYTQSIGFRLEGDITPFQVDKPVIDEDLPENFLQVYRQVLNSYLDTLFFRDKKGKLRLSNFITIKYPFFKLHAREQFYSQDSSQKKPKVYTKKEADFLEDVLWDWYERNNELFTELKEKIAQPQNTQTKRVDIFYLLKQFFSTDNFFFLRDLLQNINHKKESGNLNILQKKANELEKIAEQYLAVLSPNQKRGVEVARGSFNYFTVNKKSKNFEDKLRNLEKALCNSYGRISSSHLNLLKKVGFIDYIKNYYGLDHPNKVSLPDLYDALKDFKAKKKSIFMEKAHQIKSKSQFVEWVRLNCFLFYTKESILSDFFDITQETKKLAVEKGRVDSPEEKQRIEETLRAKKMKRGKYFQQRWGFEKYVNYCELYKRVAMERGKIKAQIKGIEQEKVEARLLKYWACLVDKGKKKQIMLIPKEKRQEVREYLRKSKGSIAILEINSLTLRALEKLVRKTFPTSIPDFNKNELLLIEKCKKVLQGRVPKIELDISGFKQEVLSVCNKSHNSKEAFRRDLETVAYCLKKHMCSNKDLEKLKKYFGVVILDITAYDLERNLQSKREKDHTQIWQQFWNVENQNNYPLRLNPEFRIFYRDIVEQYDPNDKKAKNRFSHPEVRIQFSFTHNAGSAEVQNSFADEKDLREQILKFNTTVVDPYIRRLDAKENLWYYGIDRGNQELATLGLVHWTKEKYEVVLADGKIKKFDKPEFASISVLKIKDKGAVKKITIDKKGNKKEVRIIDNPSFFMGTAKEIGKYFEKKIVSFIDLTMAKLIKGNIVLDGDVKTYLALKEANAKRKLFTIFTKIDPRAIIEFCGSNDHPAWNIPNKRGLFFMRYSFVVKLKHEERDDYQLLCYYTENISKYRSVANMQALLQDFLNKLRGNTTMETVTIDKINNLRDALTANMVGIIAHLYKTYPGVINLENLLSTREIKRHFASNNENIARRLEWGLYRKFQKMGLVPPRLKNTIFLREDMKQNRLGIIHFVKTENTSSQCPYCGVITPMKDRQPDKFGGSHLYKCRANPNCGFSTLDNRKPPLEKINNSDSVASYNIAKYRMKES